MKKASFHAYTIKERVQMTHVLSDREKHAKQRYEQQIDDRYEQMHDKSLGVIITISYSIFSILCKADFSVIFIF